MFLQNIRIFFTMSKKNGMSTSKRDASRVSSIHTRDLPVRTLTSSDFEWVNWKPSDFKGFPSKAIQELKSDYFKIKKISSSKRTFENTVLALERSGREYGQKIQYVSFLAEVSPQKLVREAAHEVVEKYSRKVIDVVYDDGIYKALCEYASQNEKLHGEEKKLFEDMLRNYHRMGFGLPRRKQAVLRRNLKKLSRLSLLFKKNINDYKDFITLTEDDAIGLSDRYLSGLKKDENGRFLVTLEYPDIVPFLENSPNDKKRKEIIDKNARKGGEKNIALLKQIVALRQANAKMLGYATFAHYAIEDRMAKSPENVMRFLTGIVRRVERAAKKDKDELLAFKKKYTKNESATLQYYDSYYVSQLQKHRYAVDNELVREYFPLKKVLQGVFETYEKVLGVTFVKEARRALWHHDAELYAVKDAGKTIAYFALDLFPRDGKYGHAAAFDLINGRVEGGKYVAPFAALVCNFSKHTNKNPSLLTHDEVETFFHEFGHIMHDILTKARYESQSGFHVAWDFVEMPSQMLENWAWRKSILKNISCHYKTHKQLPDVLVKRVLRAEKFRISTMYLRQMLLSLFDMKIHYQKAKGAPHKIYRRMVKDMIGYTLPTSQLFPAGFGHIVGGYEAGYYSYAWAKVYAQDMFTRFEKEGLLNKRTGREYRTWILEKGGSMDEMVLIKKFLGRAPSTAAFYKYITRTD